MIINNIVYMILQNQQHVTVVTGFKHNNIDIL